MVINITTKVNNIEEACRNEFGRMKSEFNTSIEALQNEIVQCYAIAQRIQPVDESINKV